MVYLPQISETQIVWNFLNVLINLPVFAMHIRGCQKLLMPSLITALVPLQTLTQVQTQDPDSGGLLEQFQILVTCGEGNRSQVLYCGLKILVFVCKEPDLKHKGSAGSAPWD